MLTPTVLHALQIGGELTAREVAHRSGLNLEATYAELARLEALDCADMRPVVRPRREFVWFALRHETPREA